MRHFFCNLNATVKELWLGIGIWGVLCELVTVWFVKDRMSSGLGILIGCLLATAGIWHMWRVLDTALDLGDGAPKYLTARSWMRYGIFVVIFGILMVTEVANPLTAFLGLMGMKAAAYMQPVIHKIFERRR